MIFMDISDIEPGTEWLNEIRKATVACPVMLVVIGAHWLTATGPEGGRRLDDPNDLVCGEIVAALAHAPRVVPVLVDGAALPRAEDLPDDLKPLLARQAHEITAQRWNYDVGGLIESLERGAGNAPPVAVQHGALPASFANLGLTAAAIPFGVNSDEVLRDVVFLAAVFLLILGILYLVERA
jgi:hypothetical protein